MGNATGIYNLMRNIGGIVGIAMATTMLARRSQFHQSVLTSHLTPYNLPVTCALQEWKTLLEAAGWPVPTAVPASPLGMLYGEVQRQSAMQAIIDDFWLLAVLAALLMIGLFFLRKSGHGAAGLPVH